MPAGRPLSIKKFLAVYDFVVEYKRTHDGNSPSLPRIAEHIKIDRTTALRAIRWLADTGMVRRGDGHRSIEVVGGCWSLTGD